MEFNESYSSREIHSCGYHHISVDRPEVSISIQSKVLIREYVHIPSADFEPVEGYRQHA